LEIMSNTPAPQDGLDVVVNADGGVTITPAELARLGLRPGAHLRLVPDEPTPKRHQGRSAGKLAHLVPASVIEEWSRALDDDRAERRAALGDVAG
jgi:hypothetical protein